MKGRRRRYSRPPRRSITLREERCGDLPKPDDHFWLVPKRDVILENVLENLTSYVRRLGDDVGTDVLFFPHVLIEIDVDDEYSSRSDMTAVRAVFSKVLQTPNSLGVGSISTHTKEDSFELVSTNVTTYRHRATLFVRNSHTEGVEAFFLDSNGARARRNGWMSRSRSAIQNFYTDQIQNFPPFRYVDSPNVNTSLDAEVAAVLGRLDIHDVPVGNAMCRHFTMMFLVELLCTSLQSTTEGHFSRFIQLDVLRRSGVREGFQVTDLTVMDRAEFVLYARALALSLYRHSFPDHCLRREDVRVVERYFDENDRRQLRATSASR